MTIRIVKVRSFSVKRRASEERAAEAAYREVKEHRSPLSEEYRRTYRPGTMLKAYGEKQQAARKVRRGRKVRMGGEKIEVRGS